MPAVSVPNSMIRRAKIQEAEILTKISFISKGYWNYPKEFYEIWSKELKCLVQRICYYL